MKLSKLIPFLLLSSLLLQACAKEDISHFEYIKIGIAPIIQPSQTKELLAGTLQNPQATANNEEIIEIQNLLDKKIKSLKRNVLILDNSAKATIEASIPRNARAGMLDYWRAYGKHYELDLLIVPYLNFYNNKENSNALLSSNTLIFDFFLIDLRNETKFLNRYLFAEQEEDKKTENTNITPSSYIKRYKKTSIDAMLEDAINNAFDEFNLL